MRTVILNVYKLNSDTSVKFFILNQEKSESTGFWRKMNNLFQSLCYSIDLHFQRLEGSYILIEELIDHLYFLNDVLNVGFDELNQQILGIFFSEKGWCRVLFDNIYSPKHHPHYDGSEESLNIGVISSLHILCLLVSIVNEQCFCTKLVQQFIGTSSCAEDEGFEQMLRVGPFKDIWGLNCDRGQDDTKFCLLFCLFSLVSSSQCSNELLNRLGLSNQMIFHKTQLLNRLTQDSSLDDNDNDETNVTTKYNINTVSTLLGWLERVFLNKTPSKPHKRYPSLLTIQAYLSLLESIIKPAHTDTTTPSSSSSSSSIAANQAQRPRGESILDWLNNKHHAKQYQTILRTLKSQQTQTPSDDDDDVDNWIKTGISYKFDIRKLLIDAIYKSGDYQEKVNLTTLLYRPENTAQTQSLNQRNQEEAIESPTNPKHNNINSGTLMKNHSRMPVLLLVLQADYAGGKSL